LRTMNPELKQTIDEIAERLCTQDNRATASPLFCLQIKVRETGFDPQWTDGLCWYDPEEGRIVEPASVEETANYEMTGYKDRWETVMVAFTEQGLKDYMDLNGHNVRMQAHNGETRIYVESLYRCDEMIAIRDALMHGRFELDS
jgi:hypothetical protein